MPRALGRSLRCTHIPNHRDPLDFYEVLGFLPEATPSQATHDASALFHLFFFQITVFVARPPSIIARRGRFVVQATPVLAVSIEIQSELLSRPIR